MLLAHQQEGVTRLAGLPTALCHHDASQANLIATASATVALDWELAGPGRPGAEVATFVIGTPRGGQVPTMLLAVSEDHAVYAV